MGKSEDCLETDIMQDTLPGKGEDEDWHRLGSRHVGQLTPQTEERLYSGNRLFIVRPTSDRGRVKTIPDEYKSTIRKVKYRHAKNDLAY